MKRHILAHTIGQVWGSGHAGQAKLVGNDVDYIPAALSTFCRPATQLQYGSTHVHKNGCRSLFAKV